MGNQIYFQATVGDEKFDLGIPFNAEELKTMSNNKILEMGHAAGAAFGKLLLKKKEEQK